jgi:ribonuclease HI
MVQLWILYCDGASRGNPGEAGAGALVIGPHGEEFRLTRYLGHKTNNQAEYTALLLGLQKLKELKAGKVEIRADSELMIRQLKGVYRVKHEGLKPLFLEAKELLKNFTKVVLKHIPREENKEADALSNDAIDHKA